MNISVALIQGHMFKKTIALSRASSKIIIRLQMRLLSSRLFPVKLRKQSKHVGESRGGRSGPEIPTPGKSQVAIGFLKNTGTDPFLKQWTPLASRGRW